MNLLPEYSKGNRESEMTNTAFGKMPNYEEMKKYFTSPELTEELINAGAGGGEFRLIGQELSKAAPIVKDFAKKKFEYVSPHKIAEETESFRKGLGAESASENITNLSKRTQFAKKSGEEEALIPKREIYSQEGKSNVYEIDKEKLPEGNLSKIAHMIEPGAEFEKTQQDALSKALKEYRSGKKNKKGEWEIKPGDTSHFIERSEELFGVEELPKKAASQIEDVLLLPTKRESNYLSDPDVSSFYSKNGKIKQLHESYKQKPTLNNYDKLQSYLKELTRSLEKRDKRGSLGDLGESRLEQFKANIANLDADANAFFKTLPEKMQDLEKTFRTKWATGPAKYKDAEITLRRLASGKPGDLGKLTDESIIKTFTRPDEKTLAAIKEMGPSVGKNVIYSALNKIKPGQGKEMAETIIDLSRKPGFEGFITKDMTEWANKMLKRSKHSELAKKSIGIGAGALAGSALGPFGAVGGGLIGMGFPYIKEAFKNYGKR